MRIESIRLKNFKVFQNFEVKNLPAYCVLVGANGTGKSTLFDVFGFLKDCLINNIKYALQKRGGFDEVLSRNAEDKIIEIEIQFRLKIINTERLVTYLLRIAKNNNQPIIEREVLRYKRGVYGSPFHFLDFQQGKGYAITNEQDFNQADTALTREEETLDPTTLAIKGLGQFQRFKAAYAFRQLLENWHISDFHINLARGSKDADYHEHLSVTGDNLQQVTDYILENHPALFQKIITIMKQRVQGISDIKTIRSPDGKLLLSFQDGAFQDPFIDRYVSDGTIKMFAYLLLLYDPKPYPLLCVEEPENQLYVKLLWELAEEFRAYSNPPREGQVFVSTHSPDFLNALKLEEVFWLVKQNGYTQIKRAKDNQQLRCFVEEGDQLGYLWKQGFFDGIDPQ
ncbi:putative ATPase [Beggiatoa alba B18LD]|uniref:Putative ATPase n=1 Tax=Beggiatoa alba B18LD TaxID=395493 RepID=I3CC18_9GAMM|nr:AAA family ATPase [Beggiatoa alba]EIJ41161.1 putative ATPase [Beggiatoa alba B18LD]